MRRFDHLVGVQIDQLDDVEEVVLQVLDSVPIWIDGNGLRLSKLVQVAILRVDALASLDLFALFLSLIIL